MMFEPINDPIKPAMTENGNINTILFEIAILLKQSNKMNSVTVIDNATAIPKKSFLPAAVKLPHIAPTITDIPDAIRINIYKRSDGINIFSISNDATARRITKTAIPIIVEYSILLSIFNVDVFFNFTPEDIKKSLRIC